MDELILCNFWTWSFRVINWKCGFGGWKWFTWLNFYLHWKKIGGTTTIARRGDLFEKICDEMTVVAMQLVLAFTRISSCVLLLFTFCNHNKTHLLIIEWVAPNCMLPGSIGIRRQQLVVRSPIAKERNLSASDNFC